jgi:glycosyltransferase involved in cell wall biosynthesis
MQILILAKRVTAHGIGGLETHVDLMSRVATERGHEVVVLTTRHPRGSTEETRSGARVEYLAEAPAGRYSGAWWRASVAAVRRWRRRGFGDLLLGMSVAGYGVARAGVDLPQVAISSGNPLAHLASEWHDAAGLRGLLLYPKRAAAVGYWAWVERWLWRHVTAVVATYDGLYEVLRRGGYRAVLAYSGTDLTRFHPDPAARAAVRGRLGIPEDGVAGLMVATVNRQKGIWVGLEAFARLADRWPGLHLVVVGDGEDRPRLEAGLAGRPHAARVHWIGAIPFEDTAPYYAAGDLLLYPTLRAEGLPTALMEAMAVGLPVVATDRGGIRSAVRPGETGVLVPGPDAAALADAVAGLLADPARRTRLAGQARALAVSAFDIRVVFPALLDRLRGLGQGAP